MPMTLRGHRGRVVQRCRHCGLPEDVPTTAFAWRPARCLAGLVLFVLLLLTRREFEMSVGPGADGSVNHWRAVQQRVGEFGPLLLGCGTERVRLPLRVCGAGLKQRARPAWVGAS